MPNITQNSDSEFYSELLRAFFDSTNDAIFVLCDEMKFIICNKMTEKWLGLPEEQLVEHNKRTPITELLGSSDAINTFTTCFEKVLHKENTFFETYINPPNGSDRWIELSMQRVDIDVGDMVIAVARDISERKKSVLEKERLQRELNQSQKMDALGQLTGGIAHDFNNILGIISGFSELSISQYEDQNKPIPVDSIKNIYQASERAKKLIAQLMLFSRNDFTEPKMLQLAPLIKEDIEMLAATTPSSINFDVNYQEDIPGVMMEPVKLQQLLLNICINAKDAMNGSGKIAISLKHSDTITAECSSCHKQVHGDWVEITISDTGSGIKQNDLARIFNPFFTTKDVGKGTGMGLAVVGSIVESFNGHIIVKTKLGEGTSIRLLFPPATDKPTSEPTTKTQLDPRVKIGNEKSILIIDDEPDLAEIMSDILSSHGYQCTTQTSSSDALTLYLATPDAFDLIITDQTMPELTGTEMITKIRDKHPAQAAIVASGYSDKVDRTTAQDHNISYIQKPVDTNALLKLIDETL